MIYTLDRIIQDVRVCLDQNRTSDALFADGDEESLKLDESIKSKILEAVERVDIEAPYHLLEQGHNIVDDENSIYWGDMESGWVLLPDDFLRLVVFEMSDWERPVYSVLSPDSPEYAKQRSRVKAIRGTAQRPVCVLGVRPEGKVLEFYSCKSEEATVSRAVYIPHPVIEMSGSGDDGVDISERCYQAVVYTISALTLTTFGEAEQAKNFFDMAKTILQQ